MACEKLPPKVDGEDVAFGDCCAMPKPDDPKIDDPVVCCGGELKPVEPPNIEPPETAPELPPPNIVPDCGDVALFAMKISIILFYRKFHIFLNCKKNFSMLAYLMWLDCCFHRIRSLMYLQRRIQMCQMYFALATTRHHQK